MIFQRTTALGLEGDRDCHLGIGDKLSICCRSHFHKPGLSVLLEVTVTRRPIWPKPRHPGSPATLCPLAVFLPCQGPVGLLMGRGKR
jgi:hypothetical protein